MKIAIAGGLGFEKELVHSLRGHSVFVAGSGYDLKREKFLQPGHCEFVGEHFNHNYGSLFSEHDLLVDVSDSLKSKYTVNDLSVRYRKPALLFLFEDGWKVAVIHPGTGSDPAIPCLECRRNYRHPEPAMLLPEVPVAEAVDCLVRLTQSIPETGLYGLDGSQEEKITNRQDCGISRGHFRFSLGEKSDVISVSCSDTSVALSPMNEVTLDLEKYRSWIEKTVRVEKITPFFLEFKFRNYHMILFRQARAVVKGTKDKNLAMALYRYFVGS